MYFIGSGALLHRVVSYSLTAGLAVDGICCPPGDPCIPRLRGRSVTVVESADPNEDAPRSIADSRDGIVFSVNNEHLIADALLGSGAAFFNIHSGLTQRYRGIAEVCVFAALCRGEERYGVTLHRLLPRQKVDSGPVVAQIEFDIAPTDCFADVLRHSLEACQRIFEMNVGDIVRGSYRCAALEPARRALTYKDVAVLCAEADAERLERACELGPYAGLLSRLKTTIDTARA